MMGIDGEPVTVRQSASSAADCKTVWQRPRVEGQPAQQQSHRPRQTGQGARNLHLGSTGCGLLQLLCQRGTA